MIGYCRGNLALLELAEISEIVEIIHYLVERENDEALLHAYQISYAALQNIPFDEFKWRVRQKAELQSAAASMPAQVHKKVEHIIDDFTWKEA